MLISQKNRQNSMVQEAFFIDQIELDFTVPAAHDSYLAPVKLRCVRNN